MVDYAYDDTDTVDFFVRRGGDEATTDPVENDWIYYGEDHQHQRICIRKPNGTNPTLQNGRWCLYVHGGATVGVVGSEFAGSESLGYLEFPDTSMAEKITGDELDSFLISVEFAPGNYAKRGAEDTAHTQLAEPRLFPQQLLDVIRAIQFVKEHFDDPDLFGAGNSINPDLGWGYGGSQGSIYLLLADLMPEDWVRSHGQESYEAGPSRENYPYEVSHRLNCITCGIPFLDFTQLNGDTEISDVGHESLTLLEKTDFADKVPTNIKRASSVWWHLIDAGADDAGGDLLDLNWFVWYTAASSTTAWAWNPGVVAQTSMDFHSTTQAQPLQDKLVELGQANDTGTGACWVASNQALDPANPPLTNGLLDSSANWDQDAKVIEYVNLHVPPATAP